MKIQPIFSIILSIALMALGALCNKLNAQQLTAYRGNISDSYNYWFYNPNPEGAEGTSKPLVIFLHGASLCGKNLNRVRTYGTLDAINKGLKLDAFVIAPQNPGGSWMPSKVNRIVDWAVNNYDIDTTRIYVLGMSLGGFGTIDYVAVSSHRVAAAMALCGGATVNNLKGLCDVPLCILHGTGDRDVSWTSSQSVVDAMIAAGDTSRLIYRLLPKKSHGALARYLYLPETYEWLFQHSLNDQSRNVNRNYDFDFNKLSNVYTSYEKPEKTLSVVDAKGAAEDAGVPSVRRSRGDRGERGDRVHIVKQGDTLSHIAMKYHTTVAKLCRLNGIKRTSILQLGQKIKY